MGEAAHAGRVAEEVAECGCQRRRSSHQYERRLSCQRLATVREDSKVRLLKSVALPRHSDLLDGIGDLMARSANDTHVSSDVAEFHL